MAFIQRFCFFFLLSFLAVSCGTPGEFGKKDYTVNNSRSRSGQEPHSARQTSHDGRHLTTGKLEESRAEIVRYAKSLIGTKYHYGGRDPRGFDCSGYTSYVLKQFGIHLPATSVLQARQGKKIPWKNSQPGDLIFFSRGGKVNHIGIVIQNLDRKLHVIHSTSSSGVRIDEVRNHPYWTSKIAGAVTYMGASHTYAETDK